MSDRRNVGGVREDGTAVRRQQYHAVRNCPGRLDGPAIFYRFEDVTRIAGNRSGAGDDCTYGTDEPAESTSSSATKLEYRSFTSLDDAADYIREYVVAGATQTGGNVKTHAPSLRPDPITEQAKRRTNSGCQYGTETDVSRLPVERPAAVRTVANDGCASSLPKHSPAVTDAPATSEPDRKFASESTSTEHSNTKRGSRTGPCAVAGRSTATNESEGVVGKSRKRRRGEEFPPFHEMLAKLRAFQNEHGHLRVPVKPHNTLRAWLYKVRKSYRDMKDGKPQDLLDASGIVELTKLGLDWTPKRHFSFDQRAMQWLEYRSRHGKDPPVSNEHDGLGLWTCKIRRKYRDLMEGKKSTLTQEQVNRLTEWGFKWESEFKKADQTWHKSGDKRRTWDESFEELKKYKEKHGDCIVPQSYPRLGCWVKDQRKAFKLYTKDGNKRRCGFNEDRLKRLQSIGFVFDVRNQQNAAAKSAAVELQGATNQGHSDLVAIGLSHRATLPLDRTQHQTLRTWNF